jgi:hypothetical protein
MILSNTKLRSTNLKVQVVHFNFICLVVVFIRSVFTIKKKKPTSDIFCCVSREVRQIRDKSGESRHFFEFLFKSNNKRSCLVKTRRAFICLVIKEKCCCKRVMSNFLSRLLWFELMSEIDSGVF